MLSIASKNIALSYCTPMAHLQASSYKPWVGGTSFGIYPPKSFMLTFILIGSGLLGFALFFKAIQFFDRIK